MNSHRNFLDADNSIMERNLRFVKNDLEENLNQYFGGSGKRGSSSSASVSVPPRDYKVVQPKPDVSSYLKATSYQEKCKRFLLQLGLARHEAYELTQAANFNVELYIKQKQDLLECGATESQILNIIMNDIFVNMPYRRERENPPPPPINSSYNCFTNKDICNKDEFLHEEQIKRKKEMFPNLKTNNSTIGSNMYNFDVLANSNTLHNTIIDPRRNTQVPDLRASCKRSSNSIFSVDREMFTNDSIGKNVSISASAFTNTSNKNSIEDDFNFYKFVSKDIIPKIENKNNTKVLKKETAIDSKLLSDEQFIRRKNIKTNRSNFGEDSMNYDCQTAKRICSNNVNSFEKSQAEKNFQNFSQYINFVDVTKNSTLLNSKICNKIDNANTTTFEPELGNNKSLCDQNLTLHTHDPNHAFVDANSNNLTEEGNRKHLTDTLCYTDKNVTSIKRKRLSGAQRRKLRKIALAQNNNALDTTENKELLMNEVNSTIEKNIVESNFKCLIQEEENSAHLTDKLNTDKKVSVKCKRLSGAQRRKLKKISYLRKINEIRATENKSFHSDNLISKETQQKMENQRIINCSKKANPMEASLSINNNYNIAENSNSSEKNQVPQKQSLNGKIRTIDLCYAIVDATKPFEKIPYAHKKTIRERISELIMQHIIKEDTDSSNKIHINSCKSVKGDLIIKFETVTGVEEVKKIVEGITTPWEGGQLTLLKKSEISLLTNARIFLPPIGNQLTNKAILTELEKQNQSLSVDKWQVYYRKTTSRGTLMIIGLDDTSVLKLIEKQCKATFINTPINFQIEDNKEAKLPLSTDFSQSNGQMAINESLQRPISIAKIPAEPSEPKTILAILQKSNPDLPTQNWKIVKVTEAVQGIRTAIVILNRDSLPLLRKTLGKVFYGFGTIFLKILKYDDKVTN